MAGKSIEQLMAEIQSDDSSTARAARNALVEREGEDVFQGLVDLLRSPRAETRNQAALALADLGDDRAVERLIAATRE